jgi:predicted permease
MRILRQLARLRDTLFRTHRLDRDLDEELEAAIATLAARRVASGMDPVAARRAAIAEFGGEAGLAQVRSEVREGRVGAGVDALRLDVRQAWRSLAGAPALSATIVLTLALGVGANTAIFSVVHAMLIEPLPYRDADRLLFVWLNRDDVGYARGPLSWPDFKDLREGSRTCEAFGGIWATGTVALTGDGDPEQLRAALVTPNFFDVLGARPELGRTFRTEDGVHGAAPTVLLGWELFERRYGGDPAIVGRQILVNDESATVIGVMPRTFKLLLPTDSSVPDRLQLWYPLFPDVENWPRGALFLRVIARMRPGVTLAEAREDLAAIAARINRETGGRRAFTTVALQADDVREIRGPLLALFAGVAILLLIACVNVAGLLVARAASRAKETALRLALGATRVRLIGQSLVEGLLLTTAGAALGVLVGSAALRALLAAAPDSLSRLEAAEIDLPVLAFTLGVSIAWGLIFSLAPTTELFRVDPARVLTGGSGRSSTVPVRYRTRASLVVVQIALSVVLLVGAGLLMRTFAEIRRVDPGFRSAGQWTFRMALPGSRYHTPEAVSSALGELQRRLESIPGVAGAGAISHLPYDDLPNWGLTYAAAGATDRGGSPFATTRAITPGLLETMGAQLLEGRLFTEHDREPVVVVDDLLARRLWPDKSAVDQHFTIGQAEPDRRVRVIGVVRHLNLRSLVDDKVPQIYVPFHVWQRSPMAFVVRTEGAPAAVAADIRSVVSAFDPRLPIFDLRRLDEYVESARSIRGFTMGLAVAFAGTALVLTCIGVYGVLAYAVASRRHEFGVRRALGADTGQVVRDVLGEGVRFAFVGCGAGLIGAALAGPFLRSQLYAVRPGDPATYAAAAALILAAAVAACWIPARRATAISPMDALRAE